jgi:hypothetical protein
LKKANRESAGAADRVLEPRFDQDFRHLGARSSRGKLLKHHPGSFSTG